EAEHGPGRLARDRAADPGERGLVVALARLAPAAVGVLVPLEPPDGALHVLLARVLADRAEPPEPRPRAIDGVDAPPPVPGPVVPLRVPQELEAAPRRLAVARVTIRAEQLEAASGQVFGRGVEERAVVREGNVVQIEAVVVGVERAPATVETLHAEHPAEA